jgi:hypothetical protein
METSLHRSLKELYSTHDSRTEAVVRGYRADVLRAGLIVEIQASPLGAIARKVADLVQYHRVLVVKPLTRRKLLLRRSSESGGDWDLRRLSPKTGKLIDAFNELVHFTRVFPHPNLSLELVLVDEEELRIPRRRRRFRRPDFRVHDRRLVNVVARRRITTALDLLDLIPPGAPNPLTTDILAGHLGCEPWFARKVAYTLRHCGVARVSGKIGNRLVYQFDQRRRAESEVMVAC